MTNLTNNKKGRDEIVGHRLTIWRGANAPSLSPNCSSVSKKSYFLFLCIVDLLEKTKKIAS
jgi:hypothetical protein